MPILDANGNPVSSDRSTFLNSAQRYDRAQPPEPLHLGDFDKLVPDMDRKTILSGSRKIAENFGPIRGAITQKADNVVGRAWDPKFTGRDKEWGRTAASWLKDQWYGLCDIRGEQWDFKTLLWLDCVACDRDGDVLIVLTESAEGYPLTQRIPANRIGQRQSASSRGDFESVAIVADGPYKGAKISNGIIRDKFNRTLAYRVLGNTAEDDRDIPARDCIFVFDPTWHDQVRGNPAFANSLKFIKGSMLSHEWEQMAQLMVSSIGLVEWNDTGGPDIDDPSTSFGKDAEGNTSPTVETLQGGMIRYFRSNSGGKIEQIDHSRPGDMWDRYQDRVIRMAMSGINWPYELVWKSSEVNAALVRNIQERARMSVEDRQDTLRVPALRLIRWAVAKAIKNGYLPAPKNFDDWWRWDFGMPRKFSIDPGKEAQQRRADYSAGIKNRSQILREEGLDPDDQDDERIDEVYSREIKINEAADRYGFPVDRRLFYMLTPNELEAIAEDAEQKPKKDTEE